MKPPKYIELKPNYLKTGEITVVTKKGSVKESAYLLKDLFIEIGGNIFYTDGEKLFAYECHGDDGRSLCIVKEPVL